MKQPNDFLLFRMLISKNVQGSKILAILSLSISIVSLEEKVPKFAANFFLLTGHEYLLEIGSAENVDVP